jgi:hypothetical protein
MASEQNYKDGELHFSEYVSNDFKHTATFLKDLFGWQTWAESENEIYLKFNNQPIMNVVNRDMGMKNKGVPPHVKNYIAVDDYEKSKQMALKLNAVLIMENEVPGFCKLGVLQIPGDLYLAIVQYYKKI